VVDIGIIDKMMNRYSNVYYVGIDDCMVRVDIDIHRWL